MRVPDSVIDEWLERCGDEQKLWHATAVKQIVEALISERLAVERDEEMMPEGAMELHRVTIVEFLDKNGRYLVSQCFESGSDNFTVSQKLGMLEQAKICVMAPLVKSFPEADDRWITRGE